VDFPRPVLSVYRELMRPLLRSTDSVAQRRTRKLEGVDNVPRRATARYHGTMTKRQTAASSKAWDGRREKYRSIRISKKAFAVLEQNARKERRTIIAQMDVMLGV
jgi:hypothetical protein